MSNLEQHEAWDEILRLKDTLPLKELARRFGATPAAIAAALRRAGAVAGPTEHDDSDLPPEPGEPLRGQAMVAEVAAALQQIRPGSKDALIAQHAHALGALPDAEVARRAGVSIRTIASFRARHAIPGYRGPRRVQRAPEVALRSAPSPSNVAQRSQRLAEPSRTSRGSGDASANRQAWQVIWRDEAGEHRAVLLAGTITDAAALAERAAFDGNIVGLALVGVVIDV